MPGVWGDIQDIVRDPGFKIIVEKIASIKEKADRDYHAAEDHDEFLKRKGAYGMASMIFDLFVDPKQFVESGVKRMSFESDRYGTSITPQKERT